MNTSQLLSFKVSLSSKEQQSNKKERLDKFLVLKYPIYSRHFFQNLISSNQVLVNGKSVKKSYPFLNDNDSVEVHINNDLSRPSSFIPQDISLNIVYEDEYIVVIDKPRGLVVHPSAGHTEGTVVNALLYRFKDLLSVFPEDGDRPGIIHRLDKDTSGLLLIAKTVPAKYAFSKLFSSRTIQKQYLAICFNVPQATHIVTKISRNPFNRKEMAVSDKGKLSITNCEVISSKNNLCLIRLSPVTGRTHQLRVHLKHIGCPILGDPVYGSPKKNAQYNLSQQLLHATSLTFTHPFTNKKHYLKSTLPKDMLTIIEKYMELRDADATNF